MKSNLKKCYVKRQWINNFYIYPSSFFLIINIHFYDFNDLMYLFNNYININQTNNKYLILFDLFRNLK